MEIQVKEILSACGLKRKTLGPAEFPAFWCAPNWSKKKVPSS